MSHSRGTDLRFPPMFAAFWPFWDLKIKLGNARFNFFGNFNLTLIGSTFPAGLISLRSDFFPKMRLPCSRTL